MKIKVRVLGLLVLVLSCMASIANAADCSWNLSGLTVNPNTFSFDCMDGSALAATKTVTVSPTSASSCSINVTSGYTNSGSCDGPNVIEASSCGGTLPKWSTALLCDAGMSYSQALDQASGNCQSCSAHTVGPCNGGAVWVCD